tara:strand:- start:490 stop:5202 length:4713 start_codon:yes stop_codon:yes gene_type:complete
MDELNLQPDALGTTDSTFEVEGYEDQIEQIQNAYPKEDFRTPAEIQAEQQQQAQPQQPQEGQQLPAVQDMANQVVDQASQFTSEGLHVDEATRIAEEGQAQQQQEALKQQEQAQQEVEKEQRKAERTRHLTARVYDQETGDVHVDSILDWEGRKISELPNGKDVIKALKLTRDYSDKEEQVYNLLNGTNQMNKLEAFHMIREDPELTKIYDHNNDGEITYDDFFDTTNLNGGDGMTDEEDRAATEEWLAAMLNPDAEQRLKGLWQQYGAGQNMALYINRKRKGYFDPSWQEDTKASGSGAWFEIGSQALETIGSVGDVMQGKGWHEDSTFDDDLLQHKNTQSLEFLVNNPLVTTEYSKDIYNGTYWGTTALLAATGYRVVGGGLTGAGTAMGSQQLAATGQLIKGLTSTTLKTGIIADTVVPGAFRQYTDHGVGMMRQRGPLQIITEHYGGPSELFAPSVVNYYNSPHFKKWDNILGESTLAFTFGSALKYTGKLFKWGHKNIGPAAHGAKRWGEKIGKQWETSTHSLHTRIDAELADPESLLRKGQQQAADIAEAGKVQMKKTSEGFRNAFVGSADNPGIGYGVYKNASPMIGQGWSKVRNGIRQVVNDIDEMRYDLFTGQVGSTDSLFSQVEFAKAAKAGITDSKFAKWAKELAEDKVWKRQLSDFNPLKKTGTGTRRTASDSARRSIQEVLGRDAASMSPDEFWEGAILNGKLDADSFEKLSDFDQWAIKNMEVQDGVNQSLLLQLRDSANATGEMLGKTDIFATDGAMRRIGDNLAVGLGQVKKTQYTWQLAKQLLRENNGFVTPEMMAILKSQSATAERRIMRETREGINLMTRMLQEQPNDELAEAVLDVFKVSNDVHNWKDFDAWMHQKLVGGEFQGKVKTGEMIQNLQGVMVQSILSGPKTPLRALLGTTLNSYLNAINEAAGATLRAPFTNDIASRKASVAKLKGMFELVPEAMTVFRRNWNAKFNANIADIRTRYSEAPTKGDELWNAQRIWTEQRGTPGEKAAFYINNQARELTNNKLFGWSPRALAATDDTFKWLLARARSKEIGMRNALDAVGDDFQHLTPELLKKAEDIHYNHLLDAEGNINLRNDSWLKKQFEEVTLTSELKGTAAKLDKVFNEIPLIKPFYLFARTGVNGLNFTYKNTPLLGALHKESLDILRHTGDNFDELAKYGINNANDLANARNLFAGRQAVGSAVVGTMGAMYMSGQLTGNGPADRQLRQQWINAGWKPNHFYIGDVGFDYTTLEPYNVIFSAIADIGDNMELMGSEWSEKRLQAAAFVIGRGLQGKTYMSGLDQLMQIAQMKPGALDKAGANILNNSIPLAGMRNEFGKWVNPHMKELNSDMWTNIRNRNQATEFLAGGGKLPEKSDILNGKPIKNWNIIGRSFNAVSPVQLDIRNDTPGRRLLLDSNYDLKSTTFAYGGYSFVKNAYVRAHFQNAIGTVPIEVGFKKFNNVEEALNHLATRDDVKESMARMKADSQNPANWDMDPNQYPHNTLIDNVMNQARAKAWAKLNQPTHPGYAALEELKAEKDGLDSKTRNTRDQIINLSFPNRQVEQFPKN